MKKGRVVGRMAAAPEIGYEDSNPKPCGGDGSCGQGGAGCGADKRAPVSVPPSDALL